MPVAGLTLGDLGERKIIRDVLRPRYGGARRFGDDCASVRLSQNRGVVLVATTDPCPPPMAAYLGIGDWFHSGWLLATINFSDLAAAGASPLGLLTSYNLPSSMPMDHFERLLDGVDGCCSAVGTQVLGGNLKESESIELSGTAFGTCSEALQVGRRGARVGDNALVIGDVGAFWAGTLGVRAGAINVDNLEHPLLRNILTPLPKVEVCAALAQEGLLRAAIDNSDGLYPSLGQLADASGLGVTVFPDEIVYSSEVTAAAAALGLEVFRLGLGWGDWQVVAAVAPEVTQRAIELSEGLGVPCCVAARFREGSGVEVAYDGVTGPLMKLDSERFTKASWFSAGIEGYIHALTTAPIVASA